ncbi:hypothetical protein [Sphingomonas jeddahensis]|uniref:Lipoprotein n=1 Tax=Sphingomonas jeddahensis TaxID=1915074 RepID=A0A1V2ES31_9SPHN|nr:hypothetical protein [Sphingomonas jeddahensis]ONF95285.1 hypothetical protein SPHI_25500 [Sphingomonas jeddahensis]
MLSFSRRNHFLAGTACLLLAACGGADDVASPGAGNIDVIVNPPAPAPTPAPSPTPSPITAADFAQETTQSGVLVTAAEQLAIVNAGSNNVTNGAAGLNGLYPVSATSLTPASNPSLLGNFFTNTNFVGALNGPTDTSFQSWTCNSSFANFGGSGAACTAVPNIGTGGASAACPTGTSDAGLVAGFRACALPRNITANLTLPKIAGVFYRFSGQTEVGGSTIGTTDAPNGPVLTIAPGVVLAADSSQADNDLIVVNRGSRIEAVGNPANPIIFTSQQNIEGTVSDTSQGQWGGLVLLGQAPTAVCATGTGPNNAGGTSATCQAPIEGITGRFYGGPNQASNSGTLQYVQIRYTGIAISEGNELQGLTLGGTGTGTTIDHVQSHNSSDDGIEIFGGTTNLKYFAVTGADDDAFDVDNGWRGFMQFIISAQRPTATSDSYASEIDSNGSEDILPRTYGRYANFTFVQGGTSAAAAIRLRGGADFAFVNGVIKTATGQKCINIVAGAGTGADRTTIRPANETLQDAGAPTFNSVYFQCGGR